jgi:hypothetical protein
MITASHGSFWLPHFPPPHFDQTLNLVVRTNEGYGKYIVLGDKQQLSVITLA